MREFIKLIVTIIVLVVISYTVYFFLESNAKYEERNNEEIIKEELNLNNENKENVLENNELQNPIVSPENSYATSGEKIENITSEEEQVDVIISGEKIEGLSEIISKINLIETKNRLSNLNKTIEDNVGVDVIGQKNRDFFEIFPEDKMAVTVQIAGTMVYIIPTPDLIDNAQYHYDADGNLALYICELVGIGGEIRYYYEDGKFLTKVTNVEDENLEFITYEDSDEILTRANIIYKQYMK